MKNISGIVMGVAAFVALKLSEEAVKDLWPLLKEVYRHVDWSAVATSLKHELPAQKLLLDPLLLMLGLRYVFKGSTYVDFADKCRDFTVVLIMVTTGTLFVLLGLNIAVGNDQVLQSLAGRRFGMMIDALVVLIVFVRIVASTRASNRKASN